MTKEDLIGRKIVAHKLVKYLLLDGGKEDYLSMQVIEEDGKLGNLYSNYITLTTANEALREGSWKLLPLETKMYKTPKGIEYGVGTTFESKGTKHEPWTITEIKDNKVAVKWGRLNKLTLAEGYTLEEVNRNIDNNTWQLVRTMKDYKQVDPKTIKFDFTNTKIKVNNEDESKWIQEVAFNNGLKWSSGDAKLQYTNAGALYFGIYGITKTDKEANYFDMPKELREITIQDILNNMTNKFKIGDVVYYPNSDVIPSHNHYTVTGYGNTKGGYLDTAVVFSNGGYEYTKNLELVSKKDKEVVGYETVVDLPGIPKGTKTNEKYDTAGWKFGQLSGINDATLYVKNKEIDNTKFFKPIYKQDAIEIKFSKHTATLSKEYGLVFTDCEKLSFVDLVKLLEKLNKPSDKVGKFGTFDVTAEVAITSVKVGCKVFTGDDIKLVSEAIKKLE